MYSKAGQGYGITKSKKKKIHDYLAKVVGNTKIGKGSTAVIIEYNTTPKDVDNVAACCKYVFDALKEIGVIEDDNREWLPILMASTCKVKTMPFRICPTGIDSLSINNRENCNLFGFNYFVLSRNCWKR